MPLFYLVVDAFYYQRIHTFGDIAMPLPQYNEIEDPLLLEIHLRGGRVSPSDTSDGPSVYESLAIYFNLTPAEMAEKTADSEARNKWQNMVRWARNELVNRGLLHPQPHGIWKLTESGETSRKT